ncbi:hypothetical protein TrLO_g7135, partial [Triparma laevis f. longispina]
MSGWMMDSLMTRDKLKGSDKEPGHAPRKIREGGGRRPASLKTGMKGASPSSASSQTLLSHKNSLSAFWEHGDDGHDRQRDALKQHSLRHKGKHVHKTLSAYKVKYTVMSKDSKHFLELVIQKIMHCWRRKQVLTLMKGFHVWKEATLTMDLDTARQVKELRNKLIQAKSQISMFSQELLDETEANRLTPEEAEQVMAERWQARMAADRQNRLRQMNKMISMLRHKSLFSTYTSWKTLTQKSKTERTSRLKSTKMFMNNMINNKLQMRWSQWREMVKERVKLRKCIRRFMGGKRQRMLYGGFRMLRRNMVEEEMEEGRLENASREELESEIKSLNAQLQLIQTQMGDIQLEKRARGMRNMERYVAMWKNKSLVSSFSSWSKNVIERKRQKNLLKKTISRMANAKLVASFEHWMSYAAFVKRQGYLGKKVLTRLTNIKTSSAFSKWALSVRRQKELENKAKEATTATFMEMEDIITELQAKVEKYEGSKQTNEELEGKVEMLESQLALLRGQLGSAKASQAEMAQKNAKKLIQTMINKALTTTFMAWKGEAGKGRENKMKAKRFIVKMSKASMYRCFAAWVADHQEAKKHKNIVKKFVARMNNSVAIRILTTWSTYCKERKKHKTMLKRFATRMKNSQALAAFVSWLEYLELRRRLKYLANKIMNRLENGKLFAAWQTWMVHVDEFREEQVRLEEDHYMNGQQKMERKAKRERARRMIQKIMNRTLSTCLNAWKDYTSQAKEDRIKIARFLKKLLNRQIAGSYVSWLEYVQLRKFLRNFMKRMIGGKVMNTLRHACKQWREFTVEMRNLEIEHGANSLHELVDSLSQKVNELESKNKILMNSLGETKRAKMEAAERNMKRRIKEWTHGALIKTFQAWAGWIKSSKEDRTKLRRFLAKLTNGVLSKCLLAWYSVIAEKNKHKMIIARVAAKIQNGVLVRVINAWRSFTSENIRQRVLLARFGKKLKNSAMLASFVSWLEWLEARNRLKYLAQQIFNRLTNGQTYAAFGVWVEEIQRQKAIEKESTDLAFMNEKDREAAEAKIRERERKKQKGLEMIQRMVNGVLAKVFFAMKNDYQQAKAERVKIARFLTKIKMRCVVSAIATWVDYCAKRRFLKGVINRFVFGKSLRLLSAGFLHWRHTMHQLKQMELEHGTVELEELVQQLKSQLESVVAQNELLSANLGETKRAKMEAAQRNMKKRVQMWINGCLTKTFGGWVKFIIMEREERTKLQRFMAKLLNAVSVKVFLAWAGWAVESKRFTVVVTRFRARMQNGVLVRILFAWKGSVEEDKRYRILVQKFAAKLKNRAAFGAFASWQEFVFLRKRLKYLALKTFNRLANAQIFGAWEVWYMAMEEAREKEREKDEMQFLVGKEREEAEAKLVEAERKKQKGLEMIQRMVNGCLANALHNWKAGAAQSKKERLMLERFVKRLKNKAVLSCLMSWQGFVGQRKWIRGFMVRMVGGAAKRNLFAAMRAWERYSNHMRELALEHGTADTAELLENLHEEVIQLKAQNELLLSQLGEEKLAKNAAAMRNMEKFIAQWQQKALISTLFAWKTYTQDCRNDKMKMQRFLAKILMGTISRCFDAWASEYLENKRHANLIKKVSTRMKMATVVRVFNAWKTCNDEEKRYRVLVARFAAKLKNRAAYGAFASWQEFIYLRKRLKWLALKTFNRLANAQIFGAWEVWFGAVEEARAKEREVDELQFLVGKEREEAEARLKEAERKKQKGLEMIQRMVNGCLATALIEWKRFTLEKKEERVKLQRFAKKLLMRCVVSTIASWRAFAKERKWLRGLMIRMVGGAAKRQTFAAMRVWERWVAHLRVLEVEHGTVDQSELVEDLYHKVSELEAQNSLLISQLGEAKLRKQENAKRSMERFIIGYQNKALTMTLFAWKQFTLGGREDRVKMKKMLGKILMGVMGRIWEAWAGLCWEKKKNALIIRKVGARMAKGSLFRVFNTWKGWLGELKSNRVIIARFSLRMKNGAALRSFGKWKEFCGTRQHLRRLATKVFNRLANAQIYGAWEEWVGLVVEAQEKERAKEDLKYASEEDKRVEMGKRAEAERRRLAALHTVQKLVNGCLASTLQSWKVFAKESKRERVVLARFAAKMKHRHVAMCLMTWIEYVGQRDFLRKFMKKLLGGKTMRLKSCALSKWRTFMFDMRQLEAKTGSANVQELVENLNSKVLELEAQNSLLIGQLGSAKLAKAEQAKKSMQKFIQQWTNRSLSTTFGGWRTFVSDAKIERVKMARFIKRMTQGWVVKCFDTWRDDVREGKRNLFVIRKVAARMQNGLLTRVFHTWGMFVDEEKRNRVTLARFGKRMKNQKMIASFRSWEEYLFLRKRLKYLAFKVFNRLGNKALWEGWGVWVGALAEA